MSTKRFWVVVAVMVTMIVGLAVLMSNEPMCVPSYEHGSVCWDDGPRDNGQKDVQVEATSG